MTENFNQNDETEVIETTEVEMTEEELANIPGEVNEDGIPTIDGVPVPDDDVGDDMSDDIQTFEDPVNTEETEEEVDTDFESNEPGEPKEEETNLGGDLSESTNEVNEPVPTTPMTEQDRKVQETLQKREQKQERHNENCGYNRQNKSEEASE